MISAHRLAWLGCCVVLLITTGCKQSDNLHPVKGKIVFEDGSPVMFGDIEFQSTLEPINARGKIQRDGTFVIGTRTGNDGALEGPHKVVIVQAITNHFNLNVVHDHGHIIAPKYTRYETSDLKVDVKPEENVLNIVVEQREDAPESAQ
ncbi:MAG: hypothetical protein P8J33_08150 [Pirellulaceae bacterium]|nr:hypothetical protein [Pirellulaceae bacterium]